MIEDAPSLLSRLTRLSVSNKSPDPAPPHGRQVRTGDADVAPARREQQDRSRCGSVIPARK
jgi:hypothetical protein